MNKELVGQLYCIGLNAKEIAEQLKEMGTLYILITGGEPFLYKDFKESFKIKRVYQTVSNVIGR